MSHPNAILAPKGRLQLARCVVDEGWTLQRAAERFQVAVTSAARWASRYRDHGEAGMSDRSSRPHRSPNRVPMKRERRIISLRVNLPWGPDRIGYRLGIQPSTVRCYEHEHPGDLVHVDVKKQGRIPDGDGHKVLGKAAGKWNKTGTEANRRPSYMFVHNAVDDYSRLAYTEPANSRTRGFRTGNNHESASRIISSFLNAAVVLA